MAEPRLRYVGVHLGAPPDNTKNKILIQNFPRNHNGEKENTDR